MLSPNGNSRWDSYVPEASHDCLVCGGPALLLIFDEGAAAAMSSGDNSQPLAADRCKQTAERLHRLVQPGEQGVPGNDNDTDRTPSSPVPGAQFLDWLDSQSISSTIGMH
jgi:hypothetical protein